MSAMVPTEWITMATLGVFSDLRVSLRITHLPSVRRSNGAGLWSRSNRAGSQPISWRRWEGLMRRASQRSAPLPACVCGGRHPSSSVSTAKAAIRKTRRAGRLIGVALLCPSRRGCQRWAMDLARTLTPLSAGPDFLLPLLSHSFPWTMKGTIIFRAAGVTRKVPQSRCVRPVTSVTRATGRPLLLTGARAVRPADSILARVTVPWRPALSRCITLRRFRRSPLVPLLSPSTIWFLSAPTATLSCIAVTHLSVSMRFAACSNSHGVDSRRGGGYGLVVNSLRAGASPLRPHAAHLRQLFHCERALAL